MSRRKSPAVKAMENLGAAEVLVVCEAFRAINVISATVMGKIHSKLAPIEKDARRALSSR